MEPVGSKKKYNVCMPLPVRTEVITNVETLILEYFHLIDLISLF
jgi:hypothetical protein